MNFLIDHKCVFDAAGNMLQNVLFAATDIRENLTKKENLRAFGTCGKCTLFCMANRSKCNNLLLCYATQQTKDT